MSLNFYHQILNQFIQESQRMFDFKSNIAFTSTEMTRGHRELNNVWGLTTKKHKSVVL